MQSRTVLIIGGITGLLAIMAGTFGAHGLKEHVTAELLNTFEVGVRYQMYHALAMLACAGLMPRLGKCAPAAIICWTLGTVVFSGSLYALAITGQRWLGMVTPVGGVLMIVGWALLIAATMRAKD
jgi:uncharacterized membrane protein YgdD (TMEM256/DUF423 family)